MKERLLKFLNAHQMTSTRLADQIGVQRSSISHILSGRNNPSYDFIYKFLTHHPDINPKWLIMGEGNMYNQEQQASIPFHEEDTASTSSEPTIGNESDERSRIEDSPSLEPVREKQKAHIERIVIFYSDHHFEEYHPDKQKS